MMGTMMFPISAFEDLSAIYLADLSNYEGQSQEPQKFDLN